MNLTGKAWPKSTFGYKKVGLHNLIEMFPSSTAGYPLVMVDDCARLFDSTDFPRHTVDIVLWDDGTAFVEIYSVALGKRFLHARQFASHQDALDFAKSLPNTPANESETG